MEDILGDKRELFTKIKQYLKKHCDITTSEDLYVHVNRRKIYQGIKFTYPLNEKDTIEVDLTVSPQFENHYHLVRSIESISDRRSRRL